VRVTGLAQEVSEGLAQLFLAGSLPLWELEGCSFAVVRATCDPVEDGWAGKTSYEELAAAVVQGRRRVTSSLTLAFVSPVTFKAGQADDLHMPLPLPGLVFGSLVDRWNAFSAVQLDAALRQFAEQRVAISHFQLASEMVPQKNHGLRIGGKGEVTYLVLEKEPYWMSVLNLLADFALYSGVGAQSATGMGQVRRIG
jgi:CRISPR-associated endoribonuclease Cas6